MGLLNKPRNLTMLSDITYYASNPFLQTPAILLCGDPNQSELGDEISSL